MVISYKTQGTCSRVIHLELGDDDIITDLRFDGGCPGNLRAVELLSIGRRARDVQKLLEGVVCGKNTTSCPDQLSRAIEKALESNKAEENGKGV